jgi:hypothetical protein
VAAIIAVAVNTEGRREIIGLGLGPHIRHREHRDLAMIEVNAAVMSVPHIVSTVSGMMVPSWFRGPRGRPVLPAERPFSRIRRRTRSFDVRSPAWRSRAQTLR